MKIAEYIGAGKYKCFACSEKHKRPPLYTLSSEGYFGVEALLHLSMYHIDGGAFAIPRPDRIVFPTDTKLVIDIGKAVITTTAIPINNEEGT